MHSRGGRSAKENMRTVIWQMSMPGEFSDLHAVGCG